MLRNVFAIFLLTSVAAVFIKADGSTTPREKPGFIFLGSIKKEIQGTVNGTTSTTYEYTNYWMSRDTAGWAEAKRDCKANGDALLQLETAEELDEVKGFFEVTDPSIPVWVAGKYQASSKTFVWESGEDILDSMWAAGQPSQQKPNSRVAANISGKNVQLKSQANAKAIRYICEGR